MRRPSRTGLALAYVFLACTSAHAQNLQSVGKEKPLSFSGAVNLNQIFHTTSGELSRREPYSFYASGTASLALYGWTVPISFHVSNHNAGFSQPFNRYSIHPVWKWLTVHVGHTSMSFSPYTVNGHTFLGAAADATPSERWTVSVLGGRFLKKRAYTTTADNGAPSYQRNGYGFKTCYGTNRNFAEIVVFHAKDEVSSIGPVPDSLNVTPQENAVASFGFGKTLFERLSLKSEMAVSALTRDTRTEKMSHDHAFVPASFLFQPRLSSSWYKAVRASIDYQREHWSIGVGWERIDPEYRTLGAYYFNNDLENVTLNVSGSLPDHILQLNASVGSQHDNVANQKMSTMRRFVGSANLLYTPTPQLNINTSVSTFQTHTHIRPAFEVVNTLLPFPDPDTLSFTQIARNVSLSTSWTFFSSEQQRKSLVLNASLQDAADRQGNVQHHAGARFLNLSLAYTIVFAQSQTSISLLGNSSFHQGHATRTATAGPTASISKSIPNRRLRIMLSSSWNSTRRDGDVTQTILNVRLNGSWQLGRQHTLNATAVMLNRRFPGNESPSRTEFTGTVGYNYSFRPSG